MKFLITMFVALIASVGAHARGSQFGEILKNTDGSIKYVTYDHARDACPQGTHLPTIRELAQESQAFGGKILEVSQVDSNNVPLGYILITASNCYKTLPLDKFYYSSLDYKRPAGELGSNWFWACSSVDYDGQFFYLLQGNDGSFGIDQLSDRYYNAVRCVQGE